MIAAPKKSDGGKILTLLDLKDMKKLTTEGRSKYRIYAAIFIHVVVFSVGHIYLKEHRALRHHLKTAEQTAADLTLKLAASEKKIAQYDSMMKVVIEKGRLARPMRISGELIVMVAGEVE